MKSARLVLVLSILLAGSGACDDGSPAGLDVISLPDTPEPGDAELVDAGGLDGIVEEDLTPADVPGDTGKKCTGAADCDDDDPCTKDSCSDGTCVNQSLPGCESCKSEEDCGDGDGCTVDQCKDQICLHVPKVDDCVDCEQTGECDDDDECTDDVCLEEGFCEFTCVCEATCLTDEDCDSGDICAPTTCQETMGSGWCYATECVVEPVDCDDGDPCTEDGCDPADGQCFHEEKSGCGSCTSEADCDDQDPCTDDVCEGEPGECHHGEIDCDDGNACTTDFCQPSLGCLHLDICYHCETDADCDDLDPCTEDLCDHENDDVCSNQPMDCDDGCDCTLDSCDPSKGCVHEPDPECPPFCMEDGDCDDGDACTVNVCDWEDCDGYCESTAVNCDDGEACTAEYCDPQVGCVVENLDGPCSDGDACTVDDACVAGACLPGPPLECGFDMNPCFDQYCDPIAGCVNEPHTGPCDDGDSCTTGDVCQAGECIGTPVSCDDGNGCTKDHCGPDIGCFYTFNDGIPCSDGNACTVGDLCNGVGDCIPGAAPNCDDGVKCTKDSCDVSVGCVHVLDTQDCDCEDKDANCEDHDPNTVTCCRVKYIFPWWYDRCRVNDC